MKTTPKQHAELRLWAIKAKVSVFVGADVLTALLDDLDEVEARADSTARLLAAESARVGELTAELDRHVARRDLEETMERVALTIAERDARTIAALESERDALAAKLDRVWEMHAPTPLGYGDSISRWDDRRPCAACGRTSPCPTVDIIDADGGE